MRRLGKTASAAVATILVCVSLGADPALARPASEQAVAAAASTTNARVVRVIDGDTILTSKGRIRLIGVDTPEVGQCNAGKATANAKRIAPVGSTVTLKRPAGENDKDAYGRLLRYMSRKGVDLGGSQIKKGLADARYDSRDGYPHHPKQAKYRKWDARYPDKKCKGSGSSASGPDTYTGCRAYGSGGTSVDDRGRRYTKIDCTTRRPL